MRVLFYGSLDRSVPEYAAICRCVGDLVEDLLDQGVTIVTREGNKSSDDRIVPIDNVILDRACKHRDEERLPFDRVMSFAETREYETGNTSDHDRKLVILPVPHRLAMYREMLAHTDVLITVGGKEGVYRLGLFGVALERAVVPMGCTGGTSRTLWNELAAAGAVPFQDDEVREILGATKVPSKRELRQLAGAVAQLARLNDLKRREPTTPQKLHWREALKALSVADLIALVGVVVAILGAVASGTWAIVHELEQSKARPSTVSEPGTADAPKTASPKQ